MEDQDEGSINALGQGDNIAVCSRKRSADTPALSLSWKRSKFKSAATSIADVQRKPAQPLIVTGNMEEDFIPREYQVKLLEQAINKNTILYLPTGSGKTFVAIMLLKHLSKEIEKPFSEGGKRSFFMVNTVALVSQQAASIKRHTPFTVGEYSGDMNVDFWDLSKWHEELEKHQILVMTCQIFLNMVLHGYVHLTNCNILIFDECHHAVLEHPMRLVMQEFKHCPIADQPRVLGLTATLINRSCKVAQVIEEVKNLEETFHSQVATVEHKSIVQKFSTNPKERVMTFKPPPPSDDVMKLIFRLISEITKEVKEINYDALEKILPVKAPLGFRHLYDRSKSNKVIKNLFEDLRIHVEMFGLHGGAKACLAHLVQLERRKCRADNKEVHGFLESLITKLHMIHRIITSHMGNSTNKRAQIYQYSTSKLCTLFEIIKEYSTITSKKSFCCVIFVERRFTAKILFHVLRDLQANDPEFSFLRPDFIVGFNINPMNDTREGRLEKKRNLDVLKKFNHKDHITNLMVSSDVLEEGIDIPALSLVVKFDFPKNHTSYIQSKGRARHVDSNYVLMVREDDKGKCMTKYHSYREVEARLQHLLVGKNDERQAPLLAAIEQNMYEEELPPYFTGSKGGPCVTMSSAVQLLNRYCSMLPQDKFTVLTPDWFLNNDENSVSVQLPISSPLKDLVRGLKMDNLKNCKRAAALETCKRLHQIKELNDNLLPRGRETELLDDSSLFPLWKQEKLTEGSPKPGTKKMRRMYNKKFPDTLSNCRVMPGSTGYLHKIILTPVYPRPTINRRIVFYDLLQSDQGFAILSAKPMPQICDFTIYLNVGEIKVHIEVNHSKVSLNADELQDLQDFNTMLFNDILRLEKTFVIVDNSNEENSYTIVPTMLNSIDWFSVREHKIVPSIQKPSEEVRSQIHVSEAGYLHTVVAPWYRTVLPDQHYIVTKVCPDMSPESPFPTPDFQSYNRYFIEKYQTHILNKTQPLVEVKAISNKMHCIKPRTTLETKSQSKRKRQQLNDDFEEHLVPELCIKYSFPAVLWLKATCLPTVLHRLVSLLLAEELRAQINKDLRIGVISLPKGMSWLPLKVDESCITKEQSEADVLGIINDVTVPHVLRTSDPYWADDREPVDIERCRLEDVRFVEIQYYETFISKSLPASPVKVVAQTKNIPLKKIDILAARPEGLGPQQYEILQALTASTANDIINLERLETLGDSFLKFAISQYLFQQHNIDEGKLTVIKGKLLGNRNLFYCAQNKKLGEIMKIYDFDPKADWIPPRMCVPRFLQKLLCQEDLNLSPNILMKLNISEEERKSGKLDQSTMATLVQKVCDAPEEAQFLTTMEVFLNRLTINDKTVADTVEALIGAYLKATGVRGALLLLGWLQILPADKATPEYMFDLPPPSALLVPNGDVNHHLRACTTIEERLGYTFKDRSFLLQALTHPSYVPNRITDNYQRLEFLGDALLDFLITCHIYESCGILSPGELTDLRSSLVNNITFASLVVRNGFHQFMLAQSPKLWDIIDRFVKLQEEQNYAINETVLYMIEEDDTEVAEAIDVPKVLGDLFESLAGAIYLDSNMSLETVWAVFYRLMHKEIEEFSKKVPKQPIRLLHEHMGQNRPEFKKTEYSEDHGCLRVEVEIIVRGEKRVFMGYGVNKYLAKMAAAKLAMRELGMVDVYCF